MLLLNGDRALEMSRKLVKRQSCKKFFNLSSIIRKVSRRRCGRRAAGSKKMLVNTVCGDTVNQPIIRLPSNSNKLKSNPNEVKSKIESLILEQHRELFSSILSENAVRKLVKQKALEIALNLGLEKKFKGTKRWLNSFLRRCQLGCSPVNNVGKTVGSNAVKQQKLNREHATLDSTVLPNGLPLLTNLFTPNQNSISHYFDDDSYQVHDSSLTENSELCINKIDCKLTESEKILATKNYALLRGVPFVSNSYFKPKYTGYRLIKKCECVNPIICKQPDTVYDELFELFSEVEEGSSVSESSSFSSKRLKKNSSDPLFNLFANGKESSNHPVAHRGVSNHNQLIPVTEDVRISPENQSFSDPLLNLFKSTNDSSDDSYSSQNFSSSRDRSRPCVTTNAWFTPQDQLPSDSLITLFSSSKGSTSTDVLDCFAYEDFCESENQLSPVACRRPSQEDQFFFDSLSDLSNSTRNSSSSADISKPSSSTSEFTQDDYDYIDSLFM